MKPVVLDWLYDEGAIVKKNNVIHANRAFIANSILIWCAKQIKSGKMSEKEIKQYAKVVQSFVHERIDLFWEKNTINVKLPEQ